MDKSELNIEFDGNKIDVRNFKNECKELINIYNFKEYRRYNHIFKAKYNKHWKPECTLAEFVWNYCKTPRFAPKLIEYIDTMTLDETVMKNWIADSNIDIDADITFVDKVDGVTYLSENPNVTHVYVLSDQLNLKTGEITIDQTNGDLLNGLIITDEDFDKINHISIEFSSLENDTHIKYIMHSSEMNENVYIIKEKDEETQETDVYYLPFFVHPVPLVHLKNKNPNSMKIKINICFEEIETNPDYPQYLQTVRGIGYKFAYLA